VKYKLSRLFLSCLLIFFFSGCAPSKNTVNTAIAQTQLAIPTATLTPEPTHTPKPTSTTKPTATPDYSGFLTGFPLLVSNFTESELGKKLEIQDVEFSGNPPPTALTIRVNADKSKFETGEASGLVMALLALFVKDASTYLPDSLETLIIIEYDGFVERTKFTVPWSDFIDFANDEINVNQLILRGKFE